MLERMMADNGYPVPVVGHDGCRVFQIHDETGEGSMTQYDLFPGVSLMYNDFHMESCDSEFYTTEDLLCIDYCRQGRMEYPAEPDAYDHIDGGHLEHMEDGKEKAADDGCADVLLFFPGKPPDLSEYFNHAASPSFAPIWAFHIS